MNIFVLDENPFDAAVMLCDKHVPKMVVESAQMMASAVIRHGAEDSQLPLTQKGTPYKGGYRNHPCTVWAGVNRSNYCWLADHAITLCAQFVKRFDKVHACAEPILTLTSLMDVIPQGRLTSFAQAMPDECKNEDAVKAYRTYYKTKTFAKWEKGTNPPSWWLNYE